MPCKTRVIQLVRDGDLESMPDGSPATFWLGQIGSDQLIGAKGLRLYANLLDVVDAQVQFIARYGLDGKSWTDFIESLDGQPLTDLWNARGEVQADSFADPREYGPLVQIGVKVYGSVGDRQGRVRLTATVVTLDEDVVISKGLFSDTLAGGVSTYTPLVTNMQVPVAAFSTIDLFAAVGSYNGAPLDLRVESSPDGATYYTEDDFTQITATGAYRLTVTRFGWYLRVSYKTGGTGGNSVGLSLDVVVRQ